MVDTRVLEAIAAMLGHRSLHMTIVYARIANRTVADEYAAAQAKVDALYGDDVPANLRQLKNEHRRMLGNGWCTRPAGTDCTFKASARAAGSFRPRSSSGHASRPSATTPRPTVRPNAWSSTSVC